MECNVRFCTILTCLCFFQLLDGEVLDWVFVARGHDLQKIQCQDFRELRYSAYVCTDLCAEVNRLMSASAHSAIT